MTYNMKKRNYILLLCILLCAAPLMAQDASENTKFPGWYVGLQGGVPFGVSQFSSFGFDKTRAGFSGGVYGGYRFNPVLSLEAQAIFGKMSMSQRDCCISGNYWLGSDGVRYHAPVLGMEGWDYAGLKSSVTTQRYGLQLNADVCTMLYMVMTFADGSRHEYTAEAPLMLAGKRYELALEYDRMQPYMYITATDINPWGEGWITSDDIFNPGI